jgi:antitoxin (DNA-binding transcriptional repressor) of toxin-antitoxin stability system
MKVENVRAAKANLNRPIRNLPKTGSVVLTRNGKPCAALMPFDDETYLEIVALSQNKRFWKIIDAAIARGNQTGLTNLEDLD